MKIKNILISILISLILLILINVYLITTYNNYIYNTLNNIINNIVSKYPEAEDITIETLLTSKNSADILVKYGINKNNISEINSIKELNYKLLIITSLIFLIIIIIYEGQNLIYNLKIKKEIKTINSYLQEIIKGSYELNIADYNEDELSILKNDIYKVTIKLKELSLYEKNEQLYLMNTLEDISHQLKTPLTALMVTNDILKSTDLTVPERQTFLNKETKELEKMEWLITTLLKYSKLDSGTVKLKLEKIKAQKIIDDVLNSLSIPLELKEINIITNDLNFSLNCDVNWTKEAFINIIKNAIEHLEPKGTITIKGENNPLYKAISIKDSGCGIAKQDLKNIFKRFYSTNNSKNSIGIGLNMAKLIIEKENGKIEVTSKEGEFTEFKIIFPKSNY